MADEVSVQADWLARSLMRQQAQAYTKLPAAGAGSHRVSLVPSHIRRGNPDAYTPRLVAIGPYHSGDSDLQPAGRLKMAYLHSLISRGQPDEALHLPVIQDYVRAVAAREQEARSFYSGDAASAVDSEAFISLLVLDGCFIIEHLVNIAAGRSEPELHATPFGPAQLALDLVLLENQIPFFVLAELFTRTRLPEVHPGGGFPPVGLLVKLAVGYLAGPAIAGDMARHKILPNANSTFHLLHLLHATVVLAQRHWEFAARVKEEDRVHHAVRKAGRMLKRLPLFLLVPLLYPILPEERRWRASYGGEGGVPIKYKRVRDGGGEWSGIAGLIGSPPLVVRMEEDRLEMPAVCIGEFRAAPLLLNLMALEQSSGALPQACSSFAAFMAKLVGSPEDAGVLVAAQLLQINSTSKEQIAGLFRQLGAASAAELGTSYMAGMLEKLRERSSHPLFMMWADVQRNYFTVPWAVVAEFVTFVSTMLQTYASFKK